MVEVNTFNPRIMRKRESAYSSGKMDMDISFKVSAKSMYGEINTGNKSFSFSQFFNNISGYKRYFVHQITVNPKEVPECRGHGKSNMLPFGFWQCIKACFYPVVSSFFAARGTES